MAKLDNSIELVNDWRELWTESRTGIADYVLQQDMHAFEGFGV